MNIFSVLLLTFTLWHGIIEDAFELEFVIDVYKENVHMSQIQGSVNVLNSMQITADTAGLDKISLYICILMSNHKKNTNWDIRLRSVGFTIFPESYLLNFLLLRMRRIMVGLRSVIVFLFAGMMSLRMKSLVYLFMRCVILKIMGIAFLIKLSMIY